MCANCQSSDCYVILVCKHAGHWLCWNTCYDTTTHTPFCSCLHWLYAECRFTPYILDHGWKTKWRLATQMHAFSQSPPPHPSTNWRENTVSHTEGHEGQSSKAKNGVDIRWYCGVKYLNVSSEVLFLYPRKTKECY